MIKSSTFLDHAKYPWGKNAIFFSSTLSLLRPKIYAHFNMSYDVLKFRDWTKKFDLKKKGTVPLITWPQNKQKYTIRDKSIISDCMFFFLQNFALYGHGD